MATFYSNKGQYTDDQIRDFINSPNFFKDEDIQYLVNQKLIRPSDDPGVLKQRATYYGLTQLLGMPESEANSATAAVFPQGGQEDVNALAKLYEQSMITGVPTGALEDAAAKLGLYGTTDSYDIQRILAERGSTNAAVTGGSPSPEAIAQYGPTVAKTGEGNLIFSPTYDAPGSETNRYALAQAVTGAKTDAEKAAALAEATKQQQAMDAAARAATDARLQQIMDDRAKAMALGLPPSTDMSGLSALSKYDFSKAAPQLRMAGTYLNPLSMPTSRTMTPGVAPTYTPTTAPTREEAFMQYAFPKGVEGATNIEDNITRGLQFARNLGLNPTETLSLLNQALPEGFITPNQLQAAVEPRAGLLALAQPRTGPSVSFQRQFGAVSPAQVRTITDYTTSPALSGSGGKPYGIDIVPSVPITSREEFAEGGDVVMGGEKAYTLADFGITTPQVAGTLGVPRDVMFNPELIAKEKGVTRTGLSDLIDLQNLAIRQGRTGREYVDMFSDLADYYGYTPEQFGRIKAGKYAGSGRMRPGYSYFAEGGVAKGLGSIAMKGYAQEMAQKGRFGDTMLAHISPEEAQMLQAAGGAGTINPETGLPEYFSWRKILKGVAKVAPFVVPFVPGLGLATKALISGVAGGLGGQKGFDFKRGLMSGLMSYGMSSLAQGAGAASGATEAATQNAITQAYGNAPPTLADYADITGVSRADAFAQAPANVAGSAASQVPVTPPPKFGNVFDSDKGFLSQLGENVQAVGRGGMEAAMGDKAAQEAFTSGQASLLNKTLSPTMAAGLTVGGYGGMKATDEMTKYQLQQKIANAKTEEERKMWEQIAAQSLGYLPPKFAAGGMMGALAAGGATGSANEPRTINGAGDGMSDSVPATIEGIQEARLADGEFVIPADVVADLGNGSSNAGSKKLYAMMDRVRNSRHGTTKQPPEINMGRLMPA